MNDLTPIASPLLPPHLRQRIQTVQNVSVIEKEGNTLIQFDLLSRLMKDRIVFIGEQVSDPLAKTASCGSRASAATDADSLPPPF